MSTSNNAVERAVSSGLCSVVGSQRELPNFAATVCSSRRVGCLLYVFAHPNPPVGEGNRKITNLLSKFTVLQISVDGRVALLLRPHCGVPLLLNAVFPWCSLGDPLVCLAPHCGVLLLLIRRRALALVLHSVGGIILLPSPLRPAPSDLTTLYC